MGDVGFFGVADYANTSAAAATGVVGIESIGSGVSGPEVSADWSPVALFANRTIPGVWYDPSDFSSMFQESSGVTPVTAVEQAVGLSLDKSRGLVLGSELITPAANRDFSSNTGYWTPQDGSITISGGAANFSSTTNVFALYAAVGAISAAAGKYYEITYTLVSCSAGAIRFGIGGNYAAAQSTPGTYTQRITAGAGGFFGLYAVGTTTASVDNVSLRELSGTHRIQPSAASRPILRARYNRLTYSEQFDNADWVKNNISVSANTETAPNGTATADTLTTSIFGYLQQTNTTTTTVNTYSVCLKAGTTTSVTVQGFNPGYWARATFDLSNGTITSVQDGTATITSLGAGWYRCAVTGTPALATTVVFIVPITTGNFYAWGADLRPSNDTYLPYQRIEAATVYDTVGFPPYLSYDGSDDGMYTGGNLDLSATDKVTVFAGVTRLGTADGMLAETSADAGTTNGSFFVYGILSDNYRFARKGTSTAQGTDTTGVSVPATSVLTYGVDLSATIEVTAQRVDGADSGSVGSTDTGSGNFGSYPLYIGRRNNTNLPFNGREYGLIVRGAATSATQIQQAERWMAAKQGRTL